jgi:hypothetical protein
VNTRFQLEQQIMMVESAISSAGTVNAFKTGASALKQAQASMGGVDQVADIMDDAAETMQDQQEIGEALSMGFGDPLGLDMMDDELEAVRALARPLRRCFSRTSSRTTVY